MSRKMSAEEKRVTEMVRRRMKESKSSELLGFDVESVHDGRAIEDVGQEGGQRSRQGVDERRGRDEPRDAAGESRNGHRAASRRAA